MDDFKCESCASVQEVIIRRKLTKLPRILILYLKRYQFIEVNSPANPTSSEQPTTAVDTETAAAESTGQQSANKVYRLVKNDSDVEITRELSLKAHLMRDTASNEIKIDKPKCLGPAELEKLRSQFCEKFKTTRSTRKRPFAEIHEPTRKAWPSLPPKTNENENGLKTKQKFQFSLTEDSSDELVDLSLGEKKVQSNPNCSEKFKEIKNNKDFVQI